MDSEFEDQIAKNFPKTTIGFIQVRYLCEKAASAERQAILTWLETNAPAAVFEKLQEYLKSIEGKE